MVIGGLICSYGFQIGGLTLIYSVLVPGFALVLGLFVYAGFDLLLIDGGGGFDCENVKCARYPYSCSGFIFVFGFWRERGVVCFYVFFVCLFPKKNSGFLGLLEIELVIMLWVYFFWFIYDLVWFLSFISCFSGFGGDWILGAGFGFGVCQRLVWLLDLFLGFGKNMFLGKK